jgi:tRNA nucleotidyltransferase (CCA-adding enzyme)
MKIELSPARVQLLEKVNAQAQALNLSCYLVGGFVRDLLLEQRVHDSDIDLVILGSASSLATALAAEIGGEAVHHESFLTAKIVNFKGYEQCQELDFAAARVETYSSSGALPRVSPAKTLRDDLARRDFSINAMALDLKLFLHLLKDSEGSSAESLSTELVDVFGGVDDLRARQLRVLHKESFLDDPTRILRLARYHIRLQFDVEEATQELLTKAVDQGALQSLSVERFWSEFLKLLQEQEAGSMVRFLVENGVFSGFRDTFLPFKGLSSSESHIVR